MVINMIISLVFWKEGQFVYKIVTIIGPYITSVHLPLVFLGSQLTDSLCHLRKVIKVFLIATRNTNKEHWHN